MGYDVEAGKAPAYGPSLKWWIVNSFWVCLAFTLHSLGFIPIDTATRLFQEKSTWLTHASWMCAVVLRNVTMCFLWYSCWHHAFYIKRIAPKEKKFNPEWKKGYNYTRDWKLALSGAVLNSLCEIFQISLWASGVTPYDRAGFLQRPVWNLFWAAFGFYWSDVHFWFAHRVMHPWNCFKSHKSFDPGSFLYRHVHAVHHKSHNPGPWSGLAMHPVEHLIYFTRAPMFAFLPFQIHPVHFFVLNIRAMLGPVFGHHGFDGYLGYKFHFLHHAKFEVNFGTSCVVPIDNVLGTYSTGGIAERFQADNSVQAWTWVFGLPYLLPLACFAALCG